MNQDDALKVLDSLSSRIVEHLTAMPEEVSHYYLTQLLHPTGRYCKEILGSTDLPLPYQNLLYLAINICLDIEENQRTNGRLGISFKTQSLYNDIQPLISILLSYRKF